MTRWFLSLQFRLVAGFAVVLVLTLGAVSAYIGYSADRAVERLQLDVDQARSDRIHQIMLRSYSVTGNWESAQVVAETVGRLFGRHIVVADIRGRIVGDSQLRSGRPWQTGRPDQRFKAVRGREPLIAEIKNNMHGEIDDVILNHVLTTLFGQLDFAANKV